jgi:Heme/copper-type cytochrome/quinol oxidases, subunit 2
MTSLTYAPNVGLNSFFVGDLLIAASLISAAFIIWVARNAKGRMSNEEYGRYRHRMEVIEKGWILFTIAAIIVLNVITFNYTPQIVTADYLSKLGVGNVSSTACPTVPPGSGYQTVCNGVIQRYVDELLPLQNEGKLVIVVVVAGQWYWHFYTVLPNGTLMLTNNLTVPAGKPVVFIMTSVDVNHDFGAYDELGTLLFQYQVSPDYVSVFTYEFNQPETIVVRCLEYCGPGHWVMVSSFNVVVT